MRKPSKIKLTGEAAAMAIRELKVRLAGDLYRRLLLQADRHGHTLNGEISRRLEDSLEQATRRTLEEICTDLRVAWGRWAGRLLTRELADELADAVLQAGDPVRIRTLAQLIVEQRNVERRGLGGVS
jgi:hypothetical protein